MHANKIILLIVLPLACFLWSCRTGKQISASTSPTVEADRIAQNQSQVLGHSTTNIGYGLTSISTPVSIPILNQPQIASDGLRDRYEAAFAELQVIRAQPQPDFKRSVFVTENAWDTTLTYQVFDAEVQKLARISKAWMKANSHLPYREKDSLNFLKNAALFRVLKDTVFYWNKGLMPYPVKMVAHLPYTYDFNDFFGRADWSKMFVSKLLRTGSGNCHSLPYLYKILADELHSTVWLSTAPNHFYIKNRSIEHGWYNTELTSGLFPTDAWITTSGYISMEAIRSGIYMDTLSQKQVIGLCIYDLAKGYEAQSKNYTDGFIIKCADAVLQYQPNHVNALILKAECLKAQHKAEMRAKGVNELNDPKAVNRFKEMETLYLAALEMGYREMPEGMYLNWLTSVDEQKDNNHKVAGAVLATPKRKFDHNPFKSIGKESKMLTLGNGFYDEMPNNDSLQNIGSVVMNHYKKRFFGFRQRDTTNTGSIQDPTVISTFWGVDPLANKFPNWSPYIYCGNNPISLVDKDGRVPYPITIRAFAPFSYFGKGFHGDNRGYSTNSNATARIHQRINFDSDKLGISTKTWSSPSSHMLIPGSLTETPSVSFTEGFKITKAGDIKNFVFGTHVAGANPLIPGSPNIDIFSSFSITENKSEGYLNISGSLKGDNFPSTEAFVTDPKGNNVFIDIGFYQGSPFSSLDGENKRDVTSFNFSITTDKLGGFTGVKEGDKSYTIADWNKQFEQANPHK